MPEAKWGGFPGAGGPVRLPGIVGRSRALEIICAARELSDKLRYALEDTHDLKEGTAALLEGRAPKFTGR